MGDGRKYIIDCILRKYAIHILAGSSGSNKTTWIFQQLRDNWEEGKQILGYDVHPVPYLYVSADRSADETAETLERLGMDPQTFPSISLTSKRAREGGLRKWSTLLASVKASHPNVELLIIDGFMGLVPPRRDRNTDGGFAHIGDFLTQLQGELEDLHLTLIVLAHATKQKEDSRYANPRDRILGSGAWPAHSSTVIILEPIDPGNAETVDQRRLILCPRNAAEEHFEYRLNDQGWLIDVESVEEVVASETFVARIKPGDSFRTADVIEAANVDRRTVNRWLKKWQRDGQITQVSKGVYQRCRPS